MTNLAKYGIKQTEWALRDYIMAVEEIPAGKETWKPTDKSRHVLDLVQECGFVNVHWTKVLREQGWVEWKKEDYAAYVEANATIESAVGSLRKTTADYLEAVAEVPDADYDVVIETPWPEPWSKTTVGGAMLHAHYHLCYHEGQINYIATMIESGGPTH